METYCNFKRNRVLLSGIKFYDRKSNLMLSAKSSEANQPDEIVELEYNERIVSAKFETVHDSPVHLTLFIYHS